MKRQPSTQQITWFLDLDRNDQLDLNPPYQRKSVWSPKDRKFFLDTIFRNYPTPPIFIHRAVNDNGIAKYHVVDGKQRLETILNFAKNKIAIDKTFGDVNLDGKKFNDLVTEEKRKFWDYTLVVDFIETVDGANIEEVFDRVNRNSRNLQPQELRHARFNGWFITEAEREAEDDFWWEIKVTSYAKEKRMKNVQLISELLFILMENKIVGFSQDYIDEMYAKYDAPSEDDEYSFDEEEYQNRLRFVKKYLIAMELENKCVSLYGKTANNLYPLWAVISLDKEHLPDAYIAAERFANFNVKLEELNKADNPDDLASENTDMAQAHVYFKNSKGASTDLPQREIRYNLLKEVLLG